MNRPIHFEIQADDIERAAEFYRTVFGWKIEKWPEMEYWMVMTAEQDSTEPGINGGLLKRPCPAPAAGQGVNAFVCTVEVEDIDRAAAAIEKAGGTLALPKFSLADMAWQAYYLDTEGNTFGIHEVISGKK